MKFLAPKDNKLAALFFSLIALLLLFPFLGSHGFAGKIVAALLNTAIVAFGLLAVLDSEEHAKKRKRVLLFFGVPAILASFRDLSADTLWSFAAVFPIFFYFYAVLFILRYLLRSKEVGRGQLYGAASIYLLLGVAFATLYHLLFVINASSFAGVGSASGGALQLGDLLYFSFVTLTTLGYGDIRPATQVAQSFVILEAIAGTLFIAFVVARFVGLATREKI